MFDLSLHTLGGRRATRSPRGTLAVVKTFVRQWCVERRLRQRDGSFRSTDRRRLLATYGAMSAQDFEDVNGAQAWFNERIIPRALQAQPLRGPWRMVDLGCGSGGSSEILGRHAPPGSTLVGYDMCPTLVERAARRDYRDRHGRLVDVRFVCQSITERLRDPRGNEVPEASVDVAHSAGVVGHHLSVDDVHGLAAELQRVLAPHGVAILDSGPRLPPSALEDVLAAHGFRPFSRHRLVPFGARVAVAFRRRSSFGRRFAG